MPQTRGPAPDTAGQRVDDDCGAALDLLLATLDATHDGIVAVDADGGFTFANKPFFELWRVPDHLRGDDRPKGALFQHMLDMVVDPQRYRVESERLPESDGVVEDLVQLRDGRVFARYSQRVHGAGPRVGRVWTFRDVTAGQQLERELQHSRDRLGQAMDASTMATWELDLEAAVFTWDDRFFALHGTTARQEGGYRMPAQTYFRELCHPDDVAHIQRAIEAARQVPDTSVVHRIEHRSIRRDDGAVRDMVCHYYLSTDEQGRAVRVWGSLQDVTSQKDIERQLARLNAELEQRIVERTDALHEQRAAAEVMLENLAEGVVACDADGRLTIFNETARTWHGCDPTDLPPERWADYYDLYEGDGVTPLAPERIPLVRAWRGEQVRNATMSIVLKGGPPRFVLASGGPILDEHGQITGAMVAMHDITAIIESERFAQASLDALGAHVAILDTDGTILATNQAWQNFADDNQLAPGRGSKGANYLEVCDNAQGAGSLDAHQMANGIRRVIQGQEPTFSLEYACHAPDVQRWFHCRVTRFAGEGPVCVVVAHEDITPVKLSQVARDQALAALDGTEDAAFIFDPQTLRFRYVNQGACRQLGRSREDLLTLTPLDLARGVDEPAFRQMLAAMQRGEIGAQQVTTRYEQRNGDILFAEMSIQYIQPVGGPPCFIAIARDVTERRRMEKQANRSQRLEAIGTLAGGVAHDLNNALAPIMLGVELLRVEYPMEQEALQTIEASARRAASMVRQLLSFAKGAEGERVLLRVERLVRELDLFMRGTFPKNIDVMVQYPFDMPAVRGDSTQLHQVLLNLCVNARDAMPDGGTLTLEARAMTVDDAFVSTTPDATPGRYVVLEVRDTGSGIPSEVLDRMFEPFYTTKGPEKGTGLGLSTVLGIVKGHGGFIRVDSRPGRGSTFQVYLPADADAALKDPVDLAPISFQGKGETVLLVDDEANVRHMARLVLRRLNLTPVTAADGADALIKAAELRNELRVVITDLHMPHLDGLAFARAVRRMLPDVPVVVASGRVEPETVETLQALGVTERLDKPFTELQLAATLRRLLDPS